jgi:hypothetical protein
MTPSTSGLKPQRKLNQNDTSECTTEAAGERVEGEQRRELRDRPARSADADEASLGLELHGLDLLRQAPEDHQVCQPDRRVQQERRAVCVGAAQTEAGEEAGRPGEQRPGRAREVRNRVVDAEQQGAALVGRRLGEDRLLDRVEDADLRARGADRRGEAAEQQQPEVVGDLEEQPADRHQASHRHPCSAPAGPVGHQRPEDGHRRRAGDRGGQDHADKERIESQLA